MDYRPTFSRDGSRGIATYSRHGSPVRAFALLIFILVAAGLVINATPTSPLESATGLALIALGLPVYFYFKRGQSPGFRPAPNESLGVTP